MSPKQWLLGMSIVVVVMLFGSLAWSVPKSESEVRRFTVVAVQPTQTTPAVVITLDSVTGETWILDPTFGKPLSGDYRWRRVE